MEIIVGHYGTDFDCLAAVVGLKKLYPKAVCVFPLHPDRNVRDFLALYQDAFDFRPEWSVDPDGVDRVIMADTQRAARLGPFAPLAEKPEVEVHVWDHHPTVEADVRAHSVHVEPLGATTTLVVRELRHRDIEISNVEATLFALGIYEDTGSLTFSLTTPEDLQSVAFLLERGANLDVVSRFLRYALTEDQRGVLNQFLLSARHHTVHGIPLVIAHAQVADYVGDVAVLTHKLALIESVDVIFSTTHTQKSIYVVGRSRTDAVDVSSVLGRFGGGGHHRAASAVVKDMTPEELEEALLSTLQSTVKPPLAAKDIMSYPVRTVDASTTVDEADKMLQRYGYSGAVVVEEERMVGIISRKDVDKARASGLGHSPVKGCMSRNVVITQPDAPLPDVEQLLLMHNVGRVPVMDGDRLVGIVSRSDLRRGVYRPPRRMEPLRVAWKGYDDLSSLIAERFSPPIRELIREAGRLADERGDLVFLVGGVVRDLLCSAAVPAASSLSLPEAGAMVFDIDLLVEGDGIGFAEDLAQSLGVGREPVEGGGGSGVREVHERFGTATIQLEPGIRHLASGIRIDVATARTEFYERPAALPLVEYSSVRDDLLRRDFTINAMAIQLNGDHFGRLLDFFGGREDLENGVIRVLHNLSFLDDPTRIFRAVRFEQRLGFAIESQTLSLLQYALESHALGQLTDTRIRDEIILMLSEPNPIPSLHRLAHLGVLEHIHEKLAFDQAVLDELERVREVLEWYRGLDGDGQGIEQWIVYLFPLLRGMVATEVRDLAWRLRLPRSAVSVLAAIEPAEDYALPILEDEPEVPPSRICELLSGLPMPVALWLFVRARPGGRAAGRIQRFLVDYRNFRLQVTGDALRELGYRPGPGYGQVLRRLLAERLDGLIGPEDERGRLRELAHEMLEKPL